MKNLAIVLSFIAMGSACGPHTSESDNKGGADSELKLIEGTFELALYSPNCEEAITKSMDASCFGIAAEAYDHSATYVFPDDSKVEFLAIDDFDRNEVDELGYPTQVFHMRGQATGKEVALKLGQEVKWMAKVGPTVSPWVSAGFVHDIVDDLKN